MNRFSLRKDLFRKTVQRHRRFKKKRGENKVRNFLKGLLWAGACALIWSCSAGKSEVPLSPDVQKESVGPFDFDFSTNESYQKSVSVQIAQDEGKIEFEALSDQPYQIVVRETTLQIGGCDSSQVQFQLFWIPDLTAAPTKGYAIEKNSRVQVYPGVKSSMVASFKNLKNCSTLDFSLNAKRIPLPQAAYGAWISSGLAPSDPNHSLRLDITQLSTSVQGVFQITCDFSNTEKFTAELLTNDEGADPKKMLFRVTAVNSTASSPCVKHLGLTTTDIGKLIYCIHNRSAPASPFQLACRVAEGSQSYPTSYSEVPSNWRRL